MHFLQVYVRIGAMSRTMQRFKKRYRNGEIIMLEIRKMQQSDKQEVLSMMRTFYDSPAVFHTPPDEVLEQDFADCVGELPFIEGVVFTEENRIAGYAMLAVSYATEYGGLCIWMEDIYTKEDYRRRGIATKLFAYAEKQYPKARVFKLEVEQENETAIAAYKRNHYKISPYFEMIKEMS